MADPKQKIQALIDKQRKAIDAQRAESERIEKERLNNSTNGTGRSSPFPSQPPNK